MSSNQTKQQIVSEEQAARNVAKYGPKEDDVIARTYREDHHSGDVWCLKNAERYMRRFLSDSEKGHNPTDLDKAADYLNRCIEANKHLPKKDIIE